MTTEAARGREAERPQDIPQPGWRDVLLRTWREMGADHVTLVAAGVGFYGLLAIFPGIAALISVAGLVLDPASVEGQIEQIAGLLPADAAEVLKAQARKVAEGAGAGVGLAALTGVLLSLYSASKGMKGLMEGMNIAYDEEESRGFLALNLVALALTGLLVFGLLVALAVVVAAPALLGSLGLGQSVQALVNWGRWALLAVLTVFGLAVIYRYGPSRENPRWRWVSPGAVAATLLWVIGSVAFSIYVRNFGSYNETYGTLGAAIILLMWFWLSAFIVLMGAELNSELEHQTGRDTTTGAERPMGERGAIKADTVGRTP
jgi:membrane protein